MSGREGALDDQFPGQSVGLVLGLALFVLNDAALLVELGLVHGVEQVSHPVRFHPEEKIECLFGRVLEVIGAILVGGAVEFGGADLFHGFEVVVVEMFAAIEHEVLEQVSEAGAAGGFVPGADVVPDVHGDDGGLVVFMDDEGEAVWKDETRVGNVDFAGGARGGRGPAGKAHDEEEPGEWFPAVHSFHPIRPQAAPAGRTIN